MQSVSIARLYSYITDLQCSCNAGIPVLIDDQHAIAQQDNDYRPGESYYWELQFHQGAEEKNA